MRIFLDTVCPRCGFRSSTEGLPLELARILASIHVCADGQHVVGSEPVERRVPGPGERLTKDEPKYRF